MKNKVAAVGLVIALAGGVSFGEETNPAEVIRKSAAAYKSLNTYQSEGTVLADINSGATKTTVKTSFTIALKKPDRYLIRWAQSNGAAPLAAQAGAVWNDGSGPYMYVGAMKAYSKMSSDETALATAVGASGGAAFTVPSLLLTLVKGQPSVFDRLVDLKLEDDELVEGDACLVVSGRSTVSKQERFWISKKNYLIRKYSHVLETPVGGVTVAEITDEQLAEVIRTSGQEVTEASKSALRQTMAQAKGAAQAVNVFGSSTELYTTIATPKLTQKQFKFDLPRDARLRESLIGGEPTAKHLGRVPPVASTFVAPKPVSVPGPETARALRTFRARGGQTVEAEYLSLKEGTVKLRRSDGKVIAVLFEKFSDEDQEFIRNLGVK